MIIIISIAVLYLRLYHPGLVSVFYIIWVKHGRILIYLEQYRGFLVKNILTLSNFVDWNTWFTNNHITWTSDLSRKQPHENQGIILTDGTTEEAGIYRNGIIYRTAPYFPSKIGPRNIEQKIALAMLQDDSIYLKIISGSAGSGKTLLACAHALHALQKGYKSKIIIAKSMTPVGREIGFLKGSMDEKVKPWLGPFYDNFIHCGVPYYAVDKMIDEEQLEITPITFIQGRSISNAVIIVDEVQNLDINILKQIITRAADDTEIILLGDPTQVFERHIKKSSLDEISILGRTSNIVCSVHLAQSIRSKLANWAVENL